MKFLKIVLFLILGFNVNAQIELFQLQWATDSSYVIGALPSGEPVWIHVDSLGIADSIYLQGDSLIVLKKGSGQVYRARIWDENDYSSRYDIPNPQLNDLYGDGQKLYYWDGDSWELLDRDGEIGNEGLLGLQQIATNIIGLTSSSNGFDIKHIVGINGIQISTNELDSLNIGIDTTALNTRINNFISDSLATIVFPSDSTNIIGGWGLDATESPANTWNLIGDSSQVATQYDLTLRENPLTFTSPLSRSTNTISIPAASTSVSGHLTSTDWNTFNNKVGGSGISTRMTYFNTANTVAPTSDFHYDSAYNRYGIGFNIGGWSGGVNNKLEITGGVAIGQTYPGQFTKPNGLIVKGEVGLNVEYSALGIGMFDYYTGFNRIDANNIEFYTNYEKMITYSANNFFVDYNRSSPRISQYATRGFEVRNVGSHYTRLTGDLYAGDSGYGGIMVNGYINKSNDYVVADDNTVGTSGLFISRLGELSFRFWDAGGQTNSNPDRTPFSINSTGVVNITNLAGSGTRIVTTSSTGDLGAGIDASTIGDITAVTVSAPITGGGTSGSVNIGISQATTSTDGYLSSTNWNTFNNKEPAITPGTTSQYWRGDKTWQTLNTGVTTLAAIGATANANGATISGSTLNLQPASASFGGVVTTGSQTFAGSKTFDYLGGTEGTNLTTGTSLIMATNAGKLENLYGTVAGYDLPLYNPTGNNWELTKLKTVNGNSLLGSGNVALTTDLSFTGASSPYTLNSNTGNDVTFAAGSGVTLSRSGDQLTIAASGMTSWNLAASGTAGSASITNGSTATITAGSGITATRSGNNITISSAAAGGEQFWTTTTNATSHEIILKDHAGTTNVSALKLIEGAGIELTTSAGTFSNSNLTINTVGTAVGQMHKEGVTTISFTAVTPQKVALTTSFTSGSGISTSDANDRITVASSGKYMITYSMDVDMNATTFGLTAYVKVSGSTDLSASYKQYNNDTNLTPLSKTFYVDLTAGQYIELWLSNSHTVSTNSLWDPILTIQRVQ